MHGVQAFSLSHAAAPRPQRRKAPTLIHRANSAPNRYRRFLTKLISIPMGPLTSGGRFADKLRVRRLAGVPMILRCPCGGIVSFIGLFDGSAALSLPNNAHHQENADPCEKQHAPSCGHANRRYRDGVAVCRDRHTRRILSLDHPPEVPKRDQEYCRNREQPSHNMTRCGEKDAPVRAAV